MYLVVKVVEPYNRLYKFILSKDHLKPSYRLHRIYFDYKISDICIVDMTKCLILVYPFWIIEIKFVLIHIGYGEAQMFNLNFSNDTV